MQLINLLADSTVPQVSDILILPVSLVLIAGIVYAIEIMARSSQNGKKSRVVISLGLLLVGVGVALYSNVFPFLQDPFYRSQFGQRRDAVAIWTSFLLPLVLFIAVLAYELASNRKQSTPDF